MLKSDTREPLGFAIKKCMLIELAYLNRVSGFSYRTGRRRVSDSSQESSSVGYIIKVGRIRSPNQSQFLFSCIGRLCVARPQYRLLSIHFDSIPLTLVGDSAEHKVILINCSTCCRNIYPDVSGPGSLFLDACHTT